MCYIRSQASGGIGGSMEQTLRAIDRKSGMPCFVPQSATIILPSMCCIEIRPSAHNSCRKSERTRQCAQSSLKFISPRRAVWPVGPYLLACGCGRRSGIKNIERQRTRERLGVERWVVACLKLGCTNASPSSVQRAPRRNRPRDRH